MAADSVVGLQESCYPHGGKGLYTDLKTIMESDPGADVEWSTLIDFKSIIIL